MIEIGFLSASQEYAFTGSVCTEQFYPICNKKTNPIKQCLNVENKIKLKDGIMVILLI